MENYQIAYLRSLPRREHCQLSFTFQYCDIQEEITVFCNVKDSIQSLTERTGNKIAKIQNKFAKENLSNVYVAITADGALHNSITCWDFIHVAKDVILQLQEQTYKIIINAPLVQEVLLPKFIYIKNVIKPLNLKSIHTIDWMCKFEWYKTKDKINWEKIGDKFTYKPEHADLNCFLKFRIHPKNKKGMGPVFEVISENPVEELRLPIKCPFEKRHEETRNKLKGKCFRVVTYNILSERYTNDGFDYCPPEYLTMEYRKHLLLKEITGYNADLICLQEVDLKVLQPFLGKNLMRNGYMGIYHKKGNRIPEGLATFLREDRFVILEAKHHVLAEEIRNNPMFRDLYQTVHKNKEVLDKFIRQATSVQVIVLQEKFNEIFIVVNSHLYYYPTDNHIRLIQIGMILKYIECVQQKWRAKTKVKGLNIPIIFCGDFNSKPASGVYEFITKGFISKDHPEWKIENKQVKDVSFKHRFQFESAYGTPEFTNYVEDFQGCLDYIFYDTSRLVLQKVNPLPSEDILSENVALPSRVFPSDHLALIVDLKLL